MLDTAQRALPRSSLAAPSGGPRRLQQDGVGQGPPPGLLHIIVGGVTHLALGAQGADVDPRWVQGLAVCQGALPAEDRGADMGLAQGTV